MKHKSVDGIITPVELVLDIDFVLHLQLSRCHPPNGPLPHVTFFQNSVESALGIPIGCERQPAAGPDSNCCQRGTGIPPVCLHPGPNAAFSVVANSSS